MPQRVDNKTVTLHTLPEDARPQLATASQSTHTVRRDDASYHAKLDSRTARFVLNEGVSCNPLASPSPRWRVNVKPRFPARGRAHRRAEVAVDASKFLVLSTAKNIRTTTVDPRWDSCAHERSCGGDTTMAA
jgi:hypothetical protein